ncbi:MAG: wax ester/triacylglycerol synthase family O-acyltransferase, partial [Burkholderiaceae bacterium]
MDHLSGMDAVFLHAESAEQPMHVGCLNVLQLPDGYEGDFFEDVKAFMARRIHLAPLFTRKLALMPFDLSNPVWVEDEDIDLEHHVRHVTLPKPGSNRQLQQAIGRQHSMLLDRSRPLWEIVIIDGLKSGEVAMYAKLHHAGMDGKAGMAVAHAIFDLTSEGRQIKPPRQKLRRNRYQLGMAELATAALRNTGQQYIKLLRMMPEMLRAARRLVPDSIAPTNFPWTFDKLMELVSPRTPLNVAITNQRSFAGRTVPVAEIKEIAALSGASFNDVVMATVSGALRRYLSASEELPDRALTAAVPVSLRKEGDTSNNNQVGMLLMDLATNEPDSIERLLRIRASTEPRKNTMDQVRSAIPMDFPMFAAPWLVSGLSSLYGRSRIA